MIFLAPFYISEIENKLFLHSFGTDGIPLVGRIVVKPGERKQFAGIVV